MPLQRICAYSGSSLGIHEAYRQAAGMFGRLMAERGIALVYGGAAVGLMGSIADGALAAGGEVIGVIPDALLEREIAHTGLTDLRVVRSMHERKALMADLADAFVALPGGLGTLEELFEVATWSQLGLHHKPVAILNVRRYFDPLVALLDHAVVEGFVESGSRASLLVDDDPAALLTRLASWEPAVVDERIDRELT